MDGSSSHLLQFSAKGRCGKSRSDCETSPPHTSQNISLTKLNHPQQTTKNSGFSITCDGAAQPLHSKLLLFPDCQKKEPKPNKTPTKKTPGGGQERWRCGTQGHRLEFSEVFSILCGSAQSEPTPWRSSIRNAVHGLPKSPQQLQQQLQTLSLLPTLRSQPFLEITASRPTTPSKVPALI